MKYLIQWRRKFLYLLFIFNTCVYYSPSSLNTHLPYPLNIIDKNRGILLSSTIYSSLLQDSKGRTKVLVGIEEKENEVILMG